MDYRVIISKPALGDLGTIARFIAQDLGFGVSVSFLSSRGLGCRNKPGEVMSWGAVNGVMSRNAKVVSNWYLADRFGVGQPAIVCSHVSAFCRRGGQHAPEFKTVLSRFVVLALPNRGAGTFVTPRGPTRPIPPAISNSEGTLNRAGAMLAGRQKIQLGPRGPN